MTGYQSLVTSPQNPTDSEVCSILACKEQHPGMAHPVTKKKKKKALLGHGDIETFSHGRYCMV